MVFSTDGRSCWAAATDAAQAMVRKRAASVAMRMTSEPDVARRPAIEGTCAPRSLRDLANDAARISRGEDAGGNVTSYDTPGADDRAITNVHAGKNECPATDPNVGADRYRFSIFRAPPFCRFLRVLRCVVLFCWFFFFFFFVCV